MNNRLKKGIEIAVCSLLSVCIVGGTALAAESTKVKSKTEETTDSAADVTADANSKDETVYVLAGADGSVERVIVSDWIKNSLGSDKITDNSGLENPENLKGDESYTMNADNMRVWDAAGNDIYYRGDINKALPVKLSVTYKLDGKTVTPDEIKGKSGKVSIRFDYVNNQYENVEIDGKTEKIYVPFVMLTGVMLDNDTVKNVTVTNGKLINDGDRTAVIGVALPGMQQNLNLSRDKVEIPDYVEITADAVNFSMENTVTLATNSVFSEIDTSKFNSITDIKSQLNELTEGFDKLLSGSDSLYGGVCQLLDKSQALVDGVNKLSLGLDALSAENDALNGGALEVFNTLLTTAQSTVKAKGITIDDLTVANYKTVLGSLITSPTTEQQNQLKNAANAAIESKLTSVPSAQYPTVKYMLYVFMTQQGKTQEQATAEITKILTDAATYQSAPAAGAQYDGLKNALISAGQPAAVAERLTAVAVSINPADPAAALDSAKAIAQNAQLYANYAATASTAAAQQQVDGFCIAMAKQEIKSALDGLNSYSEFYTGLKKYTQGVQDAADGAAQIKASLPLLTDGVGKLKDGSKQLSDGLNEFNTKGIEKIRSAIEENAADALTRLKATVDVSKDYKSFSGISDDMDGKVKFIYRTDAIK